MNLGIFNYLFGTKSITEESIREFAVDTNVKRICFSRIQTHALWKTDDGEDMITVPFGDSVGILLKEQTGIVLRKSSKGNYYKKLTSEEYEKAKTFVETYSNVVFLRDLLDASVALSLNFESDGETRTHIGQLEKVAKYDNDECAVNELASIVDDGKIYYLLDYFATVEEFRGHGIGSEFLKLLYDKVSDVEMVLCEVETPDDTTGNEYNIRSRRIGIRRNLRSDTALLQSTETFRKILNLTFQFSDGGVLLLHPVLHLKKSRISGIDLFFQLGHRRLRRCQRRQKASRQKHSRYQNTPKPCKSHDRPSN